MNNPLNAMFECADIDTDNAPLSRAEVLEFIANRSAESTAPLCVDFTGLDLTALHVRCTSEDMTRLWADTFGIKSLRRADFVEADVFTVEGRALDWHGYDVTVYCQAPLKPLAHYARLAEQAKETTRS